MYSGPPLSEPESWNFVFAYHISKQWKPQTDLKCRVNIVTGQLCVTGQLACIWHDVMHAHQIGRAWFWEITLSTSCRALVHSPRHALGHQSWRGTVRPCLFSFALGWKLMGLKIRRACEKWKKKIHINYGECRAYFQSIGLKKELLLSFFWVFSSAYF